MVKKMASTITHESLPKDCLIACFSFLSPKELALISRVSKLWNEAAQAPILWASFIKREGLGTPNTTENLKTFYIEKSSFVYQVLEFIPTKTILRKGSKKWGLGINPPPLLSTGNLLIYSTFKRDITLLDFNTGHCLKTLEEESNVTCLQISKTHLFSGLESGFITTWNLETYESTSLQQHSDRITSLCYAPPHFLISGARDGTLIKQDLSTNQLTHYEGHVFNVLSIRTLDDKIISSAFSGIKIWNSNTAECLQNLKFSLKATWNNCVPMTGSLFAVHTDESIEVWDFQSVKQISRFMVKRSNCEVWPVKAKAIFTSYLTPEETQVIQMYSTEMTLLKEIVVHVENCECAEPCDCYTGSVNSLLVVNNSLVTFHDNTGIRKLEFKPIKNN